MSAGVSPPQRPAKIRARAESNLAEWDKLYAGANAKCSLAFSRRGPRGIPLASPHDTKLCPLLMGHRCSLCRKDRMPLSIYSELTRHVRDHSPASFANQQPAFRYRHSRNDPLRDWYRAHCLVLRYAPQCGSPARWDLMCGGGEQSPSLATGRETSRSPLNWDTDGFPISAVGGALRQPLRHIPTYRGPVHRPRLPNAGTNERSIGRCESRTGAQTGRDGCGLRGSDRSRGQGPSRIARKPRSRAPSARPCQLPRRSAPRSCRW